jgi:hypothetical protein
MGVVYEARQTLMNRQVVIKVINKALLDRAGTVERFRREVEAAAKLNHPNIVTAYEAEQVGDLHLLVMEFVAGHSLAEVLAGKGRLPVAPSCHYARQVALGLQHAFERGMVHRDIKPANLILTPKGQVKILDFGLAKLVSENRPMTALTALGAYIGTPDYSAPEQAIDSGTADIRADIYSLGCTLYCLLAGRPPFQEETRVQTLLAQVEKVPRPLPELRPDVPVGLWAVVARMLAKAPERRFQTPKQVAQALLPFCKPAVAASVPFRPPTPPAPVSTSESGTEAAEFQDLYMPVANRRKWLMGARLATAVAAGVATAVAAAVVMLVVYAWVATLPPDPGPLPVPVPVPPPPTEQNPDGRELNGKEGALPDASTLVVVDVNKVKPEVYVDGKPERVPWNGDGEAAISIKPGPHKVEVRNEGFTADPEGPQDVALENGEKKRLAFRLVEFPVLIVEVNEPDAEVYVDNEGPKNVAWVRRQAKNPPKPGKGAGKGPPPPSDWYEADVSIKPGSRKVEVRKEGFTADPEGPRPVTLKDGDRPRLGFRLVEFPVLVLQVVDEAMPEVYVDGQPMHVTWGRAKPPDGPVKPGTRPGGEDAEIHVKPGRHKVVVKSDGFPEQEPWEVTIQEGRTSHPFWLWKTAPSGIQYAEFVIGNGREAGKGERVKVRYTCADKNGKDVSIGPVFEVCGEHVRGMKVNGKRKLIITRAVGDVGSGPINLARDGLIYITEVELLEVKGK